MMNHTLAMGRGDEATVFRFIVQADDGRRSREWRVWTGSGTKPTDEVYVAPRDSGDKLKVSLHRDGTGQVGFGKSVRDGLFSTDRAALDRWYDSGIQSGVRFAFCLDFPESELRFCNLSPSREAVLLEAPPEGKTLQVQILIVDTQEQVRSILGMLETGDCGTANRLDRRNSGEVFLITAVDSSVPAILEKAKELQLSPENVWAPTTSIGASEQFGIYAGVQPDTDQRFFVEIALDSNTGNDCGLPRSIAQFRGEVRPWDSLPLSIDLDVCGLIRVEPDQSETFYYNAHARCDHSSLVVRAHSVLDVYHRHGTDNGWTVTPDGGCFTLLMARTIFERLQQSDSYIAENLQTGWTL